MFSTYNWGGNKSFGSLIMHAPKAGHEGMCRYIWVQVELDVGLGSWAGGVV